MGAIVTLSLLSTMPAAAKPPEVLAFGDSLTAGYGLPAAEAPAKDKAAPPEKPGAEPPAKPKRAKKRKAPGEKGKGLSPALLAGAAVVALAVIGGGWYATHRGSPEPAAAPAEQNAPVEQAVAPVDIQASGGLAPAVQSLADDAASARTRRRAVLHVLPPLPRKGGSGGAAPRPSKPDGRRDQNALWPVRPWPRMSVCISWVPS